MMERYKYLGYATASTSYFRCHYYYYVFFNRIKCHVRQSVTHLYGGDHLLYLRGSSFEPWDDFDPHEIKCHAG